MFICSTLPSRAAGRRLIPQNETNPHSENRLLSGGTAVSPHGASESSLYVVDRKRGSSFFLLEIGGAPVCQIVFFFSPLGRFRTTLMKLRVGLLLA
jgi:hypothetical protein